MAIFFFWFLFSIAVGIYGSSKGRSGFGWFLFSMLLSPLLGLLFCAVVEDRKHPKEAAATPETHVKCPDCREWVLRDARKCKHCGSALIPIIDKSLLPPGEKTPFKQVEINFPFDSKKRP